jgi:hypothetical protein
VGLGSKGGLGKLGKLEGFPSTSPIRKELVPWESDSGSVEAGKFPSQIRPPSMIAPLAFGQTPIRGLLGAPTPSHTPHCKAVGMFGILRA